MGGMGMGGTMLWMLAWGVIGVAVLVLAVVGIVCLARRTDHRGALNARGESPEEILRRRYAAGELDEDDYLRRRAGLQD